MTEFNNPMKKRIYETNRGITILGFLAIIVIAVILGFAETLKLSMVNIIGLLLGSIMALGLWLEAHISSISLKTSENLINLMKKSEDNILETISDRLDTIEEKINALEKKKKGK